MTGVAMILDTVLGVVAVCISILFGVFALLSGCARVPWLADVTNVRHLWLGFGVVCAIVAQPVY